MAEREVRAAQRAYEEYMERYEGENGQDGHHVKFSKKKRIVDLSDEELKEQKKDLVHHNQ